MLATTPIAQDINCDGNLCAFRMSQFAMTKVLYVALFSICLTMLSSTAGAQAPAVDWSKWKAAPAKLAGTVTVLSDGVTSVAEVHYQAPNRLRLDIGANPHAGVAAQSVIATANETRSHDASSKRVQRLPFHAATQWWRSATLAGGSPLNVWFAAFSAEETAKFYTIAPAPNAAVKGQTAIELKARADVERIAVRESVRSGGAGSGKFYAVRKRAAFARPARIILTFDDAAKVLLSRAEYNERDRLQTTTEYTWTAGGLPRSAITRDFNARPIATWSFEWKTAPEFAADTWQLQAPEQIVEDVLLRPIADYRAGNDAGSKFHEGMSLARQEDYPAALASFQAAHASNPRAVAPVMAAFETTLAMRDFGGANRQLTELSGLLTAQSAEVTNRRIRLALAQRDWQRARVALVDLTKAENATVSPALLLQGAGVTRVLGDASAAAALLARLVRQAQTPPALAAQAVLVLAELNDRAALATVAGSNEGAAKTAAALVTVAGSKVPDQSTLEALPTAQSVAAIALALERSGQIEAAINAWNHVAETATEPLWREAQRHLASLYAQRGNTSNSLKAYRALLARLENENEVREFQDALFRAWDKAVKRDALRSVLQNRAIATAATDDDMRLWLAWQETYGTNDDIEATINTSVSRVARGEARAWWESRRAEFVADKAASQPPSVNGLAARARYFRDALSAVSAAQKSDPTRSYYAVQRALILSRRATLPVPVSDAASRVTERTAALDALNDLERQWPNDPDVQIAVAVQQLAVSPGDTEGIMRRLQSALAAPPTTLAGDGALDHAGTITARQLLASTLRRAGQVEAARAEYEKLWASAAAPGEQLGIALNWLNLLDAQSDAVGATQLAARLVREPRSFSATQELMSEWATSLLQRKKLAPLVTTALRANPDAASRVAAAYLDFGAWRIAGRRATAESAPVATEAALREATMYWTQSKMALAEVAAAPDSVLATQAMTLLAQDALARGDKANAVKLFTAAIQLEPSDLNLRIALARALLDEGQRDEALALRDRVLAAFANDSQTLRWAAWISLRAGQAAQASQLARRAVDRAAVEAEIGATPWQEATLLLARALMAQGEAAAAGEQYQKLAGEPWTVVDRAAVLLDWQARATDANRADIATQVASRLRDLKLTPADLQQAQLLQRSFE
ncbi:MAG: Tetratricopeptide repeat [Abditibacteriota bacterium]|nr:Tetratricopeptide repeat [Abditibacteriota bacterium]